jgi:hypothetical protein
MGRALLVCRLAARDLRRRPAEAALLLLAIVAATTTLTLGLVLHGVISKPYQSTREATAGPDVVLVSPRRRRAAPRTWPASMRSAMLAGSPATAVRTSSSGPASRRTARQQRHRSRGATSHGRRSTSPS